MNIDDLGIGTDWAADNLNVLSLWFYGGPFNATTEQMYVKLDGIEVIYNGQLNLAIWQEWPIDLAAFGIDLSNVTTFSIGFKRTGTVGGTGSILIDDIRLYMAEDQG